MTNRASMTELARVSLKLGFTAFGGPAAHIAMLHDETVTRREWTTEQEFLDMLGVTNIIPGPNSTEMVMSTGYEHQGWRGMLVSGTLFILPAATIVLALSWVYMRYGTTPEGTWLLYGIKPVIIAVVLQALVLLGRAAIKGPWLGLVGLAALALYLLGVNELVILFGGGILVMLAARLRQVPPGVSALIGLLPGQPVGFSAWATTVATAEPYSNLVLFLTFLKIGSVLYGSGYVLVAFLRNDFVERLGWLTEQQLLDAIAIGQVTPGPVFTTATFVGYLTGGFTGAVLATIAIFLPAFIFVALATPFLPRLRASPWISSLLDGLNVAAIGLMAAVAWQLGRSAIVDWVTLALAVGAAVLLVRFRVNSTWLVLAGGVVGLVAMSAGFGPGPR